MRQEKRLDRSFDVVYLVTIFINTGIIIKSRMIFDFLYSIKNHMRQTRVINHDKIELLKMVWNINLILLIVISAVVIARVILKKRGNLRGWIIYIILQLSYIILGEYLCRGVSHIEDYTFSFGLGIFSTIQIAILSITPIMYIIRRWDKKANF